MYKKTRQKKKYDFCFRRWTRKSYAAFISMNKVFKMGVILVTFSMIVMNSLVAFGQDTLTPVRIATLDEVVIIGQREDALPSAVRTITAITQIDIEPAPALTLNDLLRSLPSLDLRQRGPLGTQADLSIRGGTFDQTQILINGVNFSDPQTGHHSLNIPVDLSSVTTLEVLQGLSAPGAIGGAVNIATFGHDPNVLNLTLSGGRWGYRNISGNAAMGNQLLQAFFAASHQQSEGYVKNTDFRTANFFSSIRYLSTIGHFEAQAGYQNKDFGSYGFYSFKYPDQFEHTRTLIASLRWKHTIGSIDLSATACYRRHDDRFELFRNTAPDWYTGHNYHQNDMIGGEVTASVRSRLGQTDFSAEFRNEHIYSNVLGKLMDEPKSVPFEGDALFTKKMERQLFRGFLSHTYRYQNFAVTGGLSHHYSNDFGSYVCFAADARYRWNDFLLLYAAANQSLRLPTFTDLFYETATHDPNPDLLPEKAITYEIGTSYIKRSFKATVSAFYRQGRDLIDWVYVEKKEKSQSLNYGKVDAMGGEVQLQWHPSNHTVRNVIRKAGISYGFTSIDKHTDNDATSYILDYLKHKVSVSLEHLLFYHKLKVFWQLNFQDRAGHYADVKSGDVKAFDPFFMLDVKVTWEEKYSVFFAEVNNMLDVSYFDYAGLIQPGCWFSAGIKVKIF
jgi:iron complex outermembrane receptor protein